MSIPKVILITGASSGIGQALAQFLAEQGWVVFGTSRHPSNCKPCPRVEMLPLDVCLAEPVRECVSTVIEKTGHLDVLVNNAAYPLDGALEEASIDQVKAEFDTNFFGAVRMVNAVLPIMRRQRQGHIINISSGMALVRPPFSGYYTASKCALEGYSETLRHELKPLNIQVSVIEPGYFKSNIEANIEYGSERIQDYEPWRGRTLNAIHEAIEKSADPTPICQCVLQIITSKRPALYYTVGKELWGIPLLHRLLPQSIFEWAVRQYFKVDPVIR